MSCLAVTISTHSQKLTQPRTSIQHKEQKYTHQEISKVGKHDVMPRFANNMNNSLHSNLEAPFFIHFAVVAFPKFPFLAALGPTTCRPLPPPPPLHGQLNSLVPSSDNYSLAILAKQRRNTLH